MKSKLLSGMLIIAAINMTGCDDDEKAEVTPTITTGAVTGVTANSVTVSGEIVDDGNAEISEAGFVYSSVVSEPTISDDKFVVSEVDGTITGLIGSLNSATTYHVRAYATNKMGTGYGASVTFMTSNEAPVVSNVTISGTVEANMEVSASYEYEDAEGDPENGTVFQWYVANDATGAGEEAITGATTSTYKINADFEDKFIAVSVKPGSSAGTSPGEAVKSGYLGVGEATTVTFIYNGVEVTYGILNSATTGRKWLDRNLGAPNMASASDDFANYGDVFQWGRRADGHQLITRGPSDAETSGLNGITDTQASSYSDAGTNKFIAGEFEDWLNPSNENLWQGVNGANNPCPLGWRIPTNDEWEAEGITDIADAYSKLKLTKGGRRSATDGLFANTTVLAAYWSSSSAGDGYSHVYRYTALSPSPIVDINARGYSCRCIKD